MKRPAQLTPGAEKLRRYLKWIYRPIDRREFDEEGRVMPETFYTASALARELNVSVMTITRCVHRGLILPARATSGAMLFTEAQLETLRLHLIK